MFGSGGLGTAYVAAYLGRVLTERGDFDGARLALAGRGRPEPGSDGDALVRRAEIELLLAERRWEEALSATDAYRSCLRADDNPAWAPWRSLRAQALDGLDRRAEASALAEEELDAARRWGAPGPVARALRVLGTTRRGEGHAHLREAVAVAEPSSARLEHAKSLVALGAALRRAGQRAESREPLRRGFELATRGGATPVADAARAELYSAGGRPRRDALSGPASLTPSERRVAELAADGSSNRDIAQTLYVTPKTVEVHLTSVYRKLGSPLALASPVPSAAAPLSRLRKFGGSVWGSPRCAGCALDRCSPGHADASSSPDSRPRGRRQADQRSRGRWPRPAGAILRLAGPDQRGRPPVGA